MVERDNHSDCPLDPQSAEDLRTRGVAVEDGAALLATGRDHRSVDVDRDIRHAFGIEDSGQHTADPAIAGEDDMPFEARELGSALARIRRGGATQEGRCQPAADGGDDRCRRHR